MNEIVMIILLVFLCLLMKACYELGRNKGFIEGVERGYLRGVEHERSHWVEDE